ncbi:MAG TPA: thiosulfate oxidation carrier protein SoxY, partial [Rubrivivax sp.]|nr:thiosulfate oxidation carrier protein SoxY [Rubrivivax sp.]
KALGGSAPAPSKELTLGGPDIAENGAVVPVALSSSLQGIRRLLLLVEKNPAMLSAVFELGDGVEPDLRLNLKMAQSSNVYLVAMMADGRVLYTAREIKITIGSCGA